MLYLAIIISFIVGWTLRGSLTRAQSAVDHKTSMITGYKLCMFDIGRHRYANRVAIHNLSVDLNHRINNDNFNADHNK